MDVDLDAFVLALVESLQLESPCVSGDTVTLQLKCIEGRWHFAAAADPAARRLVKCKCQPLKSGDAMKKMKAAKKTKAKAKPKMKAKSKAKC